MHNKKKKEFVSLIFDRIFSNIKTFPLLKTRATYTPCPKSGVTSLRRKSRTGSAGISNVRHSDGNVNKDHSGVCPCVYLVR